MNSTVALHQRYIFSNSSSTKETAAMDSKPEKAPPTQAPGRRKVAPYGGYHANRVPAHDPELTETSAGTVMGEYMRRFWHPICMSVELTDTPRFLKIMNEELVAFRDKSGRV